ncbi:hypothetical protein GCM10027162_39690 [Streptomyces incanus]
MSSVDLQVRRTPLTPAFKLYPPNGVEVLHGMYEVIKRPMELEADEVIAALDVLGLGATLTRHGEDADPTSPGSVFVDSMRQWFDSVWNLLSTDA